MTFGVVASAHVPFGGAVGTYEDEVLADNPILYWRLGEASGTVAVDEMGAYNGTYTGVTKGAAGIPGAGIDTAGAFNGSSDQLYASGNASMWADGANGAAYEVWYKGTDVGDGIAGTAAKGLICANGSSTQKGFITCIDANGKAMAFVGTSYFACGPSITTINDDEWHHIVLTIEGGTYDAALYVDGVLEASTSEPVNSGWNNPLIMVGRHQRAPGGPGYTAGTFDEAAVYRPGGATALPPARIAAHYAAGLIAP